LGAFGLVFVPLAVMETTPNFIHWLPYAVLFETVGLGVSHFFITLAVYFRAECRDYFGSTRINQLVYYAAPAGIFLLFAGAAAARFSSARPVLSTYVFGGLRVLDFVHVGRQSFGVLQLFKSPLPFPPWQRHAENVFFVGCALLQFEVFLLGGRFDLETWQTVAPAALLTAVFGITLFAGLMALRQGNRAKRALCLGYFTMQAACAATAIWQTRLYLTALAMHYVEYHVVMMPRLRQPDALRGNAGLSTLVGRRPLAFYGGLLMVVVLFEARNVLSPASPPSILFVTHLFDGIFVTHYVLDAFLWRFRQPFYRRTLAPVYFGRPSYREAEASSAPSRALRLAPVLAGFAGVTLLALCVEPVRGAGAALARGFRHRVVDPMNADNHLMWGIELAEAGRLTEARSHLRAATQLDASNVRARVILNRVEEYARRSERPSQ
jgi:hypothetical protein